MNHLHISLSPEAKERLVGYRNAAGKTLRESLISSIQSAGIATATNPSLFSSAIEVDDDVPAIIGAVTILTNRTVEELVETWLLEDSSNFNWSVEPVKASLAYEQLETRLGQISQVLDLGETFIEQGLDYTYQRESCTRSEIESVARASAEMFRALRLLLGLTGHQDNGVSHKSVDE